MTLRGKQKRYLRSQAHHLRPLFQVGKEGVSTNWLNQIREAIEKRELIKINMLQNATIDINEVRIFIESNSSIQVVQVIGHTLVLYQAATDVENRDISDKVNLLA